MVYLTNNTDLAFEVPYIQEVLCKVLNHMWQGQTKNTYSLSCCIPMLSHVGLFLKVWRFSAKIPPTHTQNCKQATNAVLSFKYTSHLSLYEHKSLQVKIYFTVNVKR